ncbi:MAG TPA: hypothetical protein VK582_10835 [Pyrinomonadaceae bacterium]|nr:hypothetical protein [Pyrinomonadaceae bacterium]
MIPRLEDRVLPEGIHRCTLEECEAAFGGFMRSDRRPRLAEALRRYIGDARSAGVAVAVLVDGSYVTAKEEPRDVDLILVLRADFDLSAEVRPMEYNVQSRRAVKKRYGFDVLPATEGSEAYDEYVRLFSQIRQDDPEQKTPRSAKGLLRIEL